MSTPPSTTICYGAMFPDVSKLRIDKPNRSKVATIEIESQGIGIQRRQLSFDEQQWKECVGCKRFDDCYKLSIAKLLMQQALIGLS